MSMKGRLIDFWDHLVWFWPAQAHDALKWGVSRARREPEPEVVYLPRGGRRRRRGPVA